jgi:RHS repeat-associated protein
VGATASVTKQVAILTISNQKLTSSTLGQPFGFTGREYDSETGLYYYRARYYEPKFGRFISEDPIRFDGGMNFYAYAGNNPVTFRDPLGLDWLQNLANYSAGAGDNLSFGLTKVARNEWGDFFYGNASRTVNECSTWYRGGEWSGTVLSTAIGGGAGLRSAAKKVGTEFSHWVPVRMGGPRSLWNGNFVTPRVHYLSDPYRYPIGWRAFGPKLNPGLQQLVRIPKVYKGAVVGMTYGTLSQMWGGR